MTIHKLNFELSGTTEDPELAVGNTLGTAARAGIRGVIRKVSVDRTAGSGTQWKLRLFLGDTADKDQLCVASILIPATPSDFDHDQQATVVPKNPIPWSVLEKDFGDVWTSGVPDAGAGLYASLQQVAGSGDDTVDVYIDTTRDRG